MSLWSPHSDLINKNGCVRARVCMHVPYKNLNTWSNFNRLSTHIPYDPGTNTVE